MGITNKLVGNFRAHADYNQNSSVKDTQLSIVRPTVLAHATSKLVKITTDELKAARCKAYSYLLP
jgi:hypothetical protein